MPQTQDCLILDANPAPFLPIIATIYVAGMEIKLVDSVEEQRTVYYAMGGAFRIVGGDDAGLYFSHGDHLGSTSVMSDENGVKVPDSEVVYAPFGEIRAGDLSELTDFGHRIAVTGQQLDRSTGGLMYYGARYYLPELRRFISADTIVPGEHNPQAFNRYTYVLNNPVNYVDPTGHCAAGDMDCWNYEWYKAHKYNSGIGGGGDNQPHPEPDPLVPNDPAEPVENQTSIVQGESVGASHEHFDMQVAQTTELLAELRRFGVTTDATDVTQLTNILSAVDAYGTKIADKINGDKRAYLGQCAKCDKIPSLYARIWANYGQHGRTRPQNSVVMRKPPDRALARRRRKGLQPQTPQL